MRTCSEARNWCLSRLVVAHAAQGEIEQTCVVAREAIGAAQKTTTSARTCGSYGYYGVIITANSVGGDILQHGTSQRLTRIVANV